MLTTGKVYRYKSSGKLLVDGGYGYYLDLDKRLQFTNNNPHKINPSTELIETHWRIELEIENGNFNGHKMSWKHVRSFSINDVPPYSYDNSRNINNSHDDGYYNVSIPLEKRINISPSNLFNHDEEWYIGKHKSAGSWKFRLSATVLTSGIAFYFNETASIIVFLIGFLFTVKQLIVERKQKAEVDLHNERVDLRKQETLEAKERVRNTRMSKIDSILSEFSKWEELDGQSFEVATGELFKKKGYSVEFTQTSNDGGIDLILRKDTEQVGVQCKAYNKNVGVAAARELHGIKSQWTNLNKFMLVGLHGFTKQAREFAKEHNLELFSVEKDHFNIG